MKWKAEWVAQCVGMNRSWIMKVAYLLRCNPLLGNRWFYPKVWVRNTMWLCDGVKYRGAEATNGATKKKMCWSAYDIVWTNMLVKRKHTCKSSRIILSSYITTWQMEVRYSLSVRLGILFANRNSLQIRVLQVNSVGWSTKTMNQKRLKIAGLWNWALILSGSVLWAIFTQIGITSCRIK